MIDLLNIEYELKNEPIEFLLAIWKKNINSSMITCRATKFNDNGNPVAWAIYDDTKSVLSKLLKVFCFENLPSNRDEKYLNEFRFETKDEAINFFKENFQDKKINLTLEENYKKLSITE